MATEESTSKLNDEILALIAKIDRLQVWETTMQYNWVIKPLHSAMPYFVVILRGEVKGETRYRLLFIEGWNTFTDYICFCRDRSFGFYQSTSEFAHYEVTLLGGGATDTSEYHLLRFDTGFAPGPVTDEKQLLLCRQLLWETYGFFLRIENEDFLMEYAQKRIIYMREEGADGVWKDKPFPSLPVRNHVETFSLPVSQVTLLKEKPIDVDEAVDIDFRLIRGVMTTDKRKRSVYSLIIGESFGDKILFVEHASPHPCGGLRDMWENLPSQIVKYLLTREKIPGKFRTNSPKIFRMLRIIATEVSLKLLFIDNLPTLDQKYDIIYKKLAGVA